MDQAERKDTAQHALVYVGVGAAIFSLLMLCWYAFDVVLLLFVGALLAVLLRAPADWLSRRTGLAGGWTLALVILALTAVLAASAALFGRAVVTQSAGLAEQLPQAWEKARGRLEGNELGRRAVEAIDAGAAQQEIEFLSRGLRLVGSTLAALGSLVVVLFLAVFLALDPRAYTAGFLKLVVPRRRARAGEVLQAVGHTLKRWLIGQVALMLIVGTLTGIGLLLLGVPFALPLALIAGLLEFVPYFGPILATAPALMIGFAEGTETALWIAALYFGVQSLEGYILTPLIQHRAVDLPPALILLAQVLMGVTAGPMGVVVATPLAAVALVAVRMLYVEDVLGDRADATE